MQRANDPAAPPEKQRHRVLIADDDLPTRMLLRAAVSRWGYETVEASDGEVAWELLNAPNAPRLLVLDWLMPKLDGIALCERIKEKLSFHPYTILLTQLTGSTNVIKALEAGADEFLSKPFNTAELHSRLSTGSKIIDYQDQIATHAAALSANPSTALDLRPLSNPELITQLTAITTQKGGKIAVETKDQQLHITLQLPI